MSAPSGISSQSRRFRIGTLAGVIVGGVLIVIAATLWFLPDLHLPSDADLSASRRAILLISADGHDLFPNGAVTLAPVSAEQMPADVINAVLSIEDRRFYQHLGLDPISVLRALKQNIEADRIVAGGSTITQQLAKILFLSPERTYKRKIQELAVSFWIEHHLTKDEILTSYLNNVYLGSGATGFPAGAKVYFGKKIKDLSLPEAAMLAGIIKAPSEDDPLHDLNAARRRAALVLDAMVANGKLTKDAAIVAKLHPATPASGQISSPSSGWFADWVYDKAAAVIAPDAGTVRLRTTLNSRLQDSAANIVKSVLARYRADKHVSEAALVAMRPDGAVVAMVGGLNYGRSPYNRAVQAERQPGSAFKLFDYYAALRQGFKPDDNILDAPVDLHGWQPANYGRRYHGEVTLADAFAESLNDATVRLSQEVGIPEVIAAARDLGLRGKLQDNSSLALGTSEVNLLDMTSAYASVSAGKAPVTPWGISAIKTSHDPDYMPVDHSHEAQHSLGPYQAELTDLLQGVVEHGTGRAAALQGFAAGKTGTTQDFRDAWFIGFDDSLVVGVWVGNDDHTPMKGVVGGSLPAMIWKNFMQQAQAAKTIDASSPMHSVPEEPPEPASAPDQAQTAQCDVPACTEFYHSFRASDCTYQPYEGSRQYCER